MRPIVPIALAALVVLAGSPSVLAAEDHHHHASSGKPAIPSSLQVEHRELHASLMAATRLGGKTGEAARALEAALMPHFRREEEFALPPLGLLSQVSQGKVTPEMHATLEQTEALRRELPRMLKEHGAIVQRLEQLEQAATREKQAEVLRFARSLKAHAVTEEELLYPTSLLVGEYLKLRLEH